MTPSLVKTEGIDVPDDISEKLDILIKLQAAALTTQMESSKDKIVGTTPNHVNVTLSGARKTTAARKKR
jgi:hypothetical protein